jgi:hypothetical protein
VSKPKPIKDAGAFWTITPHPEVPLEGVEYGDEGEVIETGTKDGRQFIRHVAFPKKKWKKSDVKTTAAATGDCEFCGPGVPLDDADDQDGPATRRAPKTSAMWTVGAVGAGAFTLAAARGIDNVRGAGHLITARRVVSGAGIVGAVWSVSGRSEASRWREPVLIASAVVLLAPLLLRAAPSLPQAAPLGQIYDTARREVNQQVNEQVAASTLRFKEA